MLPAGICRDARRASQAQNQGATDVKKERRRAHLLKSALEVFGEKGYHAATVSDIIKRAGVARGTFYLYFGSKRAVFDQLLDDLFGLLHNCVKRIDPTRGPQGVLAQMEANIDAVLELMLGNRAMLRILLSEAVGLDPEFDKKVFEFYDRLVKLTAHSLRLGIEMNIVRPLDPEVVAVCIIGSIKEVLYQISIGRKLPNRQVLVTEILSYGGRGLLEPQVARKLGQHRSPTRQHEKG
ncbi:MAG: TetR/AcrR family transcriptional regulator [Deltaproteobacteria bacterium]|nr:MAG: TetR/AcrR family transcriptional regulator [Deltaproteobacteria bacterium]